MYSVLEKNWAVFFRDWIVDRIWGGSSLNLGSSRYVFSIGKKLGGFFQGLDC